MAESSEPVGEVSVVIADVLSFEVCAGAACAESVSLAMP
jgi:hypothetical protein